MRCLAVFLTFCGLCPVISGQDYWTYAKVYRVHHAEQSGSNPFQENFRQAGRSGQRFSFNAPLTQLLEEAIFLTTLQDPGPGLDLGGMQEGEHLRSIVQTDNTTESIWVWSRFRHLTGDNQFDSNIDLAWDYVMNFPAYLEEGGGGSFGYYRIYNCAWALIAEPAYRAATSDTSYLNYARTCADYIRDNPLALQDALNVQVSAMAAVALYEFALEQFSPDWKQTAVNLGNDVRMEVESRNGLLKSEFWAMAGGTIVWGVLGSYFQDNSGGRTWALTYGPMLKEIDPIGQWRLAHTNWYTLGRYAAWKASGDPMFFDTFHTNYAHILNQDMDDDGGIPTWEANVSNQDESWVSNYLAYMGIHNVLEPLDPVLAADQRQVMPGQSLDLSLGLGNHDQVLSAPFSGTLWAETQGGGGPLQLAPPFQGHLVPAESKYLPNFLLDVPLHTPATRYWLRLEVGTPGGAFYEAHWALEIL